MAEHGPWEDYQTPEHGPWEDYQEKPQKPGIGKRIWEGLNIPEKLSKQGLGQIAQAIPQGKVTGNLPMDILRGTPKISAETFAKTAPPFVSRASLLTMGAAPMIGAAVKGAAPIGESIASGLEDWTGMKPSGSLAEAFKKPFFQFMTRGPKAAKSFYQAGEQELPAMVKEAAGMNPFKGMYKPEQIVDKAREILDSGEKLEPSEALTYRKAVDGLMKSGRYVKDELISMRNEANELVKESENFSKADVLHRKGMMAQALRALGPKNVGGRFSPFKVGEALALSHMGPLGKVAGAAFSPAVLGAGASTLGAASQIASNPRAAVTVLQLLRNMRNRPDENTIPQ